MRLRTFLPVMVALAVFCAAGCATSSNKAMQAKLITMARSPMTVEEYKIEPPDTLSIEVKSYPEYSRQVTVRPDGKITVAPIGDVKVQGLTTGEAAAAIEQALLEELAQPSVTVSLLQANSKAVYVLGEVRRPGRQLYYGDMNLVDALGQAGWFTQYADIAAVKITRASLDEPSVLRANLRKLVYKGAAEQNVVLEDGDVVYVPPTGFAKVGYAMDQLLFPFRAVLGGLITYGQVDQALDDD